MNRVAPGALYLVSVGPGDSGLIVPRAWEALAECEVVIGYELYLRWIAPQIAGKEIHSPPLTQERERARLAIEKARAGARVALVSSGDVGVYAMATLAFEEMLETDTFAVNVIPGITAANACASLLGAPLSHDFATLSLSDLMCPWEWIEERARHIGAADLACVLYNVQSQSRVAGVYRIFDILLEHKSPETLCGVVRNAYRPDQRSSIHALRDLSALSFDMLTSVVIGNRFTRRRRDWIFTPRGYNDWGPAERPGSSARTQSTARAGGDIPERAIWVYSGTSDGNALARELAGPSSPVVVSTASEYGGDIAKEHCPQVTVCAGRLGIDARRRVMRASHARAIVDATHPYAQQISRQLIELAGELAIPYVRFERPGTTDTGASLLCDTAAEAAEWAIRVGRRIFLATGSKDLPTFLEAPGAHEREWFVRLTPEPALIRRAVALGIRRDRIVAMQGPFSRSFNRAVWSDQRIDCVVTKDSGEAGGFSAKIEAAASLDIPVVVIRRPVTTYPNVARTFDEVRDELRELESRTRTPHP